MGDSQGVEGAMDKMLPTHNAKRAVGISRNTMNLLVATSPKTIGIVFLPTARAGPKKPRQTTPVRCDHLLGFQARLPPTKATQLLPNQ